MRGQSMRKSARSSTAALVWTTVQQETRSSGPAALAVDRYGRNPRATFQRLRTLPSWNATSHGSGDEGDGHLVAASVLKPAVVHGRVRRVVALAVSPPAPPSKRPCPTARRRGCSWSGAVTASPWLLRVKQQPKLAADPGGRGARTLAAHCRMPAPPLSPTEACRPGFWSSHRPRRTEVPDRHGSGGGTPAGSWIGKSRLSSYVADLAPASGARSAPLAISAERPEISECRCATLAGAGLVSVPALGRNQGSWPQQSRRRTARTRGWPRCWRFPRLAPAAAAGLLSRDEHVGTASGAESDAPS